MAYLGAKQIFGYAEKLGHYDKWTPLGGMVSRLGIIEEAYATPCSITPRLWVQAAWVSAPTLIYLYAKPFLRAEEAYRWLDKKCGKKGGRGLIRRLANGLGIQNPDVFERPPGVGKATWAMWQIAGDFALRAQWYLMIGDYYSKALYNFVSLPYEWEGCVLPNTEWAELQIPAGTPIGEAPGFINEWTVQGFSGFFADYTGIVTGVGKEASIFGGLSFQTNVLGDPPPSFTMQINGPGMEGVTPALSWIQKDGRQLASFAVPYYGGPAPGGYYTMTYFPDRSPPFTCGGAFMQAYGHKVGKRGINFDP